MTAMRRCLVTGSGGFLGGYVVRALASTGRNVTALGRRPVAGCRFIAADLSTPARLSVGAFDEVYHLAGLAHVVPRTKAERHAFYQVNREGTRRLLEALDESRQPERFLLISTVAVYGMERGILLAERTERRASDPYGESKRQAEDLVLEWAGRRGIRAAVIRLPLVAGAGAPGNLGALIEAIRRGRYRNIGSGEARRSMVMADDVAAILPRAAETGGVFHLTDGVHPQFRELSAALAEALGCRRPGSLPEWVARGAARVGDVAGKATGRAMPINSQVLAKLTSTLTFSDEHARRRLGWSPSLVLGRVPELISEQPGMESSIPSPCHGRG